MLKKWTAAILAAALLLCCLGAGAAAKQVEADWSGLTFTMRDIPSNKTVSFSGKDGIPTVLLFGGVGTCYNTNNFIQIMFDMSDELRAGSLQVFFVDLRGISDENVAYVFSEVEIPQGFYIGVQETIAPQSPLLDVLELANGSRSYAFTMPAVAYLDANGTVKEAFTGPTSRLNILAALRRIGVTNAKKTSADVLVKGSYRQTEARRELAMVNDLRLNNAWFWNEDNETKTERDDLQPLVYDYALEKVAMQRAAELAMSYDHTRPDGGSFTEAYTELGYAYSTAGENIAYGYGDAEAVQNAWEEERLFYEGQGHRRNMLNAGFRAFGCACFEYEGTLFWAQEFSGEVVSANAVPANDKETVCKVAIHTGVVTGWWTEPETLELKIGETRSLREGVKLFLSTKYDEEFETAETPVWRSADAKTARVNADGTITALKEGSTAVTCVLQSRNGDWTVAVNVNVKGSVPFAAEKAAFERYKEEAARSADAAAAAGDSETCFTLIDGAKAALGSLTYDEAKTPQANNAAADAILAKLEQDLGAQRAADRLAADKAAFEAQKAELKKKADDMALPGDSAACAALIEAAKAKLDATAYDESLSLLYNNASAEETIKELRGALNAQRKADARLPGDVDGNGAVTAADARLALRAAVGLERYARGEATFTAADADKNNTLTAADARLILRAAVGLERLSK